MTPSILLTWPERMPIVASVRHHTVDNGAYRLQYTTTSACLALIVGSRKPLYLLDTPGQCLLLTTKYSLL